MVGCGQMQGEEEEERRNASDEDWSLLQRYDRVKQAHMKTIKITVGSFAVLWHSGLLHCQIDNSVSSTLSHTLRHTRK